MKTIKRSLLSILILSMLIFTVSCNNDTADVTDLWDSAIYTEDTVLGQGEKTVVVEVSAEEKSIELAINTDAETLGEALLSLGLIEGEESAYGIYINVVNGILADYDVDGYYWSLCKNGEYLMTGADTTPISNAEHYELIRTK